MIWTVPQCVRDATKAAPQLIITDSARDKVTDPLEGRPTRKQVDEFEKAVATTTTVK